MLVPGAAQVVFVPVTLVDEAQGGRLVAAAAMVLQVLVPSQALQAIVRKATVRGGWRGLAPPPTVRAF